MNLLDLIVGKPLKTSDERAEQIGPVEGIPIFGLDALSSATYGPEAALSLLIPLGLLGVRYINPSWLPRVCLAIIFFSRPATARKQSCSGDSDEQSATANQITWCCFQVDRNLSASNGVNL